MLKKLGKPFGAMVLTLALMQSFNEANAQKGSWEDIDKAGYFDADTVKQKGYTLIFINKDASFAPKVKAAMINTFFEVYPKECKIYNKKSLKKVTMMIDPAYKGVAATGGGLIRVNPEWMHKNPEDIDVVTHEAMHIVQSYPGWSGPGWVTEGIADYVRATLGVNNEKAHWSLTPFNAKQNYDNAYRITARFLLWVEKNKKKGFVKKLDAAMRNKSYSDDIWVKETGKSVKDLWAEYAQNPAL